MSGTARSLQHVSIMPGHPNDGDVVTYDGTMKMWKPAAASSGSMPPGIISAYSNAAAPTGWLLCDGSAVSRATYAALYAIIGGVYGIGDGSTTFNLPDLRDRLPMGASGTKGLGTVLAAATHTHTAAAHTHPSANHSHVLSANGRALISFGTNILTMSRQTTGFTPTHSQPTAAGFAGATTPTNLGAPILAGTTDNVTPADTGSTAPGDSGATQAPLPPYQAVTFIIKT